MKDKPNPFPMPTIPEGITQFAKQFRVRYERIWTLIEQSIEEKISLLMEPDSANAAIDSSSLDPSAAIRLLESAVRSLARAQECRTKLLALAPMENEQGAVPVQAPKQAPLSSPEPSVPRRIMSAPIIPTSASAGTDHNAHNLAAKTENNRQSSPIPENKATQPVRPSAPQASPTLARKQPIRGYSANSQLQNPLLSSFGGSYAQLRELAAVPI